MKRAKVVKATWGVHKRQNGNSATLRTQWRCTLECSHTAIRVRDTEPSWLLCKECE